MTNIDLRGRHTVTLPLLPLRDVVVFPHMVIPLFVGRPKSIKALETAMEAGKSILLVAQKSAAKDEPVGGGSVRHRHRRQHPADAEAARRHREGAGGRRAARAHRCDRRPQDALHRGGASGPARSRGEHRARGDAPRDDLAVRPVREAEQEDPARDPDLAGRHRRAGPAGRHHRRAPAAQARAEAGGAGDVRRAQAPRASAGADGNRARHPAGREAHPRPRQEADGEEPARVLPERAGQGDPEGARRHGRGRRPGRDGKAHQGRAHAQGSARTRPKPS